MANKGKIAVLCCCGVLFAGAAVLAVVNAPEAVEGQKNFTVEIYSERDGENSSGQYSSEDEFFGQWCREQDFIGYNESEYGIYIYAVKGYEENIDEQYWWCIMENGEDASVGADSLPLTDGSVYRLELRQGWE